LSSTEKTIKTKTNKSKCNHKVIEEIVWHNYMRILYINNKNMKNSNFEPEIVAFVCNWCTYAGADLTGTSRIKYPSNVKIIRFPCTGRIDFMFLLKAFSNGADGIIISGCHPNDCHYTSGNLHARRRWIIFRTLLDFMGIDIHRITFSWVSAAEGAKWAEIVNQTTNKIKGLGPYKLYKKIANETWENTFYG
jgi:coenzyme F420-reducing hydrogenase delta subunit